MGALNVTTEQIENIMLDTGVTYINYGVAGERILAPTRGGNTFTVEQDVRIIERDGAMGKEKGLRRVIREDAMLTVRIMDMSIQNIKLALAGAIVDGSKIINTQEGVIAETEYLDNVTWIGTDMEGKTKVITLYNAMADNGLAANFVDKDEAVVEIQFAGHRDPTDKTAPLYEIEEVAVVGTSTITFNIDDGVSDVENAKIEFNGQIKLTNSSGVAIFTNVADRTNTPVKITKTGFVTLETAIDVAGNATESFTLTAV
jgi:hypothetical protein